MTKPTPPAVTCERIATQLAAALDTVQRGEFQQALPMLTRVLQEAKRVGLEAPDANWGMCCALDNTGDPVGALEHVRRALAHDPLSPSYRRSFGIVVNRLREGLLADDRPPFDPEVRKLYALLQEANAADVVCHVRFGAFLVATKRYEEAREHLLAVAQLAPNSTEAWVLLAQVAMETDDEVLASHCSSMVTNPPQPEGQGTFPQFGDARG